MKRITSLLRNVLLKDRVDRDLSEEVHSYLDLLVEQKIAAGMTEPEARHERWRPQWIPPSVPLPRTMGRGAFRVRVWGSAEDLGGPYAAQIPASTNYPWVFLWAALV